jgi:hypothetical protein
MNLKKILALIFILWIATWAVAEAAPTEGKEIAIPGHGNGDVVPVIPSRRQRVVPVEPPGRRGHQIERRRQNGPPIDVHNRIDHLGIIGDNGHIGDQGVIDGRLRFEEAPPQQPDEHFGNDSSDGDGGNELWTRMTDHEIKFLEGATKPILCLDSKYSYS